MLKEKYGIMKLKKGTILYHLTDDKFRYKHEFEKPFLNCVFHPSDFYCYEKYIIFVELKKDIEILFMVKDIKNLQISSALKDIFNTSYCLCKLNLYIHIANNLKIEKLDGIFSPLNNNVTVQLSLLNDLNLFKINKFEKIQPNKKGLINHLIYPKIWKYIYPICDGIELQINDRYKNMIKDYIERNNNDLIKNDKKIYSFGLIMTNTNNIIKYHLYNYNN